MKKRFLVFTASLFIHSFGMPTCGAEELEEVNFDYCDPTIAQSEIQRIFLAKIGAAPFTDWTQAAEWTLRVSESDTASEDTIRALTVIADKPAPASTRKDVSNGRKIITRKDHVINFTIDEVTDENHAFMQSIENGKRYRMWYETAGGYMFGGNDGIIVEAQADMVLPRGQGEIMTYAGTMTWVSPQTEQRCSSPIFGQTVLGSDSLDTTIDFTADATPAHGSCDFVLVGGVNAVAKFKYNDIDPTIGVPLVMTIKVSTVLKLTCNMTADFNGDPFEFIDILGGVHTGFIAAGDVNF